MPAVNILVKPASSACNMNCAYCFYRDVAQNRGAAFEGMLSPAFMERVIEAGMAYADGACSFLFQGGEPTLAGLDFYRQVILLEQKYARRGVAVHNALQTNGYCLDDEWAVFFAENNFLIGLSLDGPAALHNQNRIDTAGKGTFHRVLQAANVLRRHGVSYNILCVVTGRNARSIEQIYSFFKKERFRWLQFIPCLEPLGQPRGSAAYHLSPRQYGDFLIRIFDLWYADLKKGDYISIRHLDNWLAMLLGEGPEACGMSGVCSIQFVVEGDGGVYPCDFYALDEWRIGVVGEQGFEEMLRSETARRFIAASRSVPEVCKACEAYPLCRNGCRRDRTVLPSGRIGLNAYCASYRLFFAQRASELRDAALRIVRMRSAM